jgi:hypothetical protein
MDRLELEVAPRPDELLDATCKRSIVQNIRIETKNPKGFVVERKSAGRFARIGQWKEKKLAKVDGPTKPKSI